MDIIIALVEKGGIPKFTRSYSEAFIAKIGTAPEHQSNTGFLLAVARYRIAIEKPNGMGVPYFDSCFRKTFIQQSVKTFTNNAIVGRKGSVIGGDVLLHMVFYTKIRKNLLLPQMLMGCLLPDYDG